ncbi:MAG TPA: hypothetical protein VFF73_28855 [Planctomycetota bacterium]|nr:hypothetical protein [Planctomycetota bacterium]
MSVEWKVIEDEIMDRGEVRLDPLKTALVVRIPGKVRPRGSPSFVPEQIKGMVDVARVCKPELEVTLKDENGSESKQKVAYWQKVHGNPDLADHFNPDAVVRNMRASDGSQGPGLLLRLRLSHAAVSALRDRVESGEPIGPDFLAWLKTERDRVKVRLAKFVQKFPEEATND